MTSQQCHLIFGAIADVQYAEVDDGTNFAQTRRRYYRAALESLKRTIETWKNSHSDLAFVLQLGDLIDGVNFRKCGPESVPIVLKSALAPFDDLTCPTYHTVGNHDLYNLTRRECLMSKLNSGKYSPGAELGSEDALYYSVRVHPRLRIVVLDTYEVGVLGFKDCPDHPHFIEAQQILEENNINSEKNSGVGLEGVNKRFVAYNGCIGKQQLNWLEAQLTDADLNRQNVLICGHVQFNPVVTNTKSCTGICLLWNYSEVQRIVHAHRCVIGSLFGHDHDGSNSVDEAGIPHLVMNGVIETPPDSDAYATCFLYSSSLEVRGSGVVPSVSMPLKYPVDDGGDGCI